MRSWLSAWEQKNKNGVLPVFLMNTAMNTSKDIKYFLTAILLFAVQVFVCGQTTVTVTLTYTTPNTRVPAYPVSFPLSLPPGVIASGQIWGAGGGGGGAKAFNNGGNGHAGCGASGGGGGGSVPTGQ